MLPLSVEQFRFYLEPIKGRKGMNFPEKSIAGGLELWVPFFQEKGTNSKIKR